MESIEGGSFGMVVSSYKKSIKTFKKNCKYVYIRCIYIAQLMYGGIFGQEVLAPHRQRIKV